MNAIVRRYAREASKLADSASSTEETFYPAIRTLLADLLDEHKLPFEMRSGTSEQRGGGGADRPDLALYDGDFVSVFCEVKPPSAEIDELARSTERNDQIGRYLAQTRIVLLCNVRAFGLLAAAPDFRSGGPVPPEARQLLQVVEIWPSRHSLLSGQAPEKAVAARLGDLLEDAVTGHAPIADPESLARILARQARQAKDGLPKRFSQAVQGLLEDFAKALGIHFEGKEGEEFLRSSLVQTVFYSLFAGWALWNRSAKKGEFRWEDLPSYLRIPFLGGLFHEIQHPRRISELGLRPYLGRATETLGRVWTGRFFERFQVPDVLGGEESEEQAAAAILYFYEPFLEAFDPELRKELGVWYTPPEIVQFQVRRIDQLLREELGCKRGFADDRVIVLDPCCGTGAYLVEVVRAIARQLSREGLGGVLGETLLKDCCQRILGFEVLTAPFVVAQLQLYLILSQLGVEPRGEERLAVFLTNALTGWSGSEQLKLNFPELQEEHDAAQWIKSEAPIIVILGNPPYNRFSGVPVEEEAELVDHYKGIDRDSKGRPLGTSRLYSEWAIRKHTLDDLYIRFFRLAESQIGERAEYGIVSFISNSSFYVGRSHPIMRRSLLKNFDRIWIDNLNGDKYKTGKVIPKGLPGAGKADQSVFTTEYDPRGIQVGIGLTTLLKTRESNGGNGRVSYRDFWGSSYRKRQALLQSLSLHQWGEKRKAAHRELPEGPRAYTDIRPEKRFLWRFAPYESHGGYEDWPGLNDLFPVYFQGVNPNRGYNSSIVDMSREDLSQRMRDYFDDALSFEDFCRRHPILCTIRARYEPRQVREYLLQSTNYQDSKIKPYVVFPFDLRWIYYEAEAKLINERRPELAANLEGNRFLVAVPQPRRVSESKPLSSSTLFDLHLHDRGSVGFPAEILPGDDEDNLFNNQEAEGPEANLAPEIWEAFRKHWGLEDGLDGADAREMSRTLFDCALAIGHSPQYQGDHRHSLSQEWARLPIPQDREALAQLAESGRKVARLIDPCLEADDVVREVLGEDSVRVAVPERKRRGAIRSSELLVAYPYFGAAQGRWEEREPEAGEPMRAEWGETTGDLYLNEDILLRHVPREVWRFELGGYPVVKKWLGYRDSKRRDKQPLDLRELRHLCGLVRRLAALLALHPTLDELYERALKDAFTVEDLGL